MVVLLAILHHHRYHRWYFHPSYQLRRRRHQWFLQYLRHLEQCLKNFPEYQLLKEEMLDY
jgi:uncharacterized protein YpiB (UPF0302 family)